MTARSAVVPISAGVAAGRARRDAGACAAARWLGSAGGTRSTGWVVASNSRRGAAASCFGAPCVGDAAGCYCSACHCATHRSDAAVGIGATGFGRTPIGIAASTARAGVATTVGVTAAGRAWIRATRATECQQKCATEQRMMFSIHGFPSITRASHERAVATSPGAECSTLRVPEPQVMDHELPFFRGGRQMPVNSGSKRLFRACNPKFEEARS